MDLCEARNSSRRRHPWELYREKFLEDVLGSIGKSFESVTDFGSGDSWLVQKMFPFPKENIFLVDKFYSPSEISQLRAPWMRVTSVDQIKNKQDLVLALDVLEHIEDPHEFRDLVQKLFSPNTECVVTVPAFNFLFSEHDVKLKHFRRYDKDSLRGELISAGLEIQKIGFFFPLSFLIALLRKVFKLGLNVGAQDNWSKKTFWLVSTFFKLDYLISKFFLNWRIPFPGLSIYAVAKLKVDANYE